MGFSPKYEFSTTFFKLNPMMKIQSSTCA